MQKILKRLAKLNQAPNVGPEKYWSTNYFFTLTTLLSIMNFVCMALVVVLYKLSDESEEVKQWWYVLPGLAMYLIVFTLLLLLIGNAFHRKRLPAAVHSFRLKMTLYGLLFACLTYLAPFVGG